MSDYTQEEIRLLDLCAASWVGGLAADSNMKGRASEFAAQAYDLATAMIAERRKRVPQPQPTAHIKGPSATWTYKGFYSEGREFTFLDLAINGVPMDCKTWQEFVNGNNACVTKVDVEPMVWTIPDKFADAKFLGGEDDPHAFKFDPAPVAQPRPYAEVRKELGLDAQPQPEQAGELTEEAVRQWAEEANRIHGTERGVRYVGLDEIDRAVALMREGLRAKQERDELLRLGRMSRTAAAQCADGLMESAVEIADLRARAEKAEKERDEAREEADRLAGELAETNIGWEQQLSKAQRRAESAEAALAEAQPVLGAVARYMDSPCSMDGNVLRAYADRRREQAKGAK